MNTKDNYSRVPWFASRDFRAVASFVCLFFIGGGGGGNIARGSGGILPQKGFKFGGSEALFSLSALVMNCVRKIGLEYENGKQLQVTVIKITESKENKSINRLSVSGSTGPLGNERKKSKALTWDISHKWIKLKGLVNDVWRRNRYMCGYFIFNSLSLSSFYLELPRILNQWYEEVRKE